MAAYDITEAVGKLRRIVGPKFTAFLLRRVGAKEDSGRILVDEAGLRQFAEEVRKVVGARIAESILREVPGLPSDVAEALKPRRAARRRPPSAGLGVAPVEVLERESGKLDDIVWVSDMLLKMKLVAIERVRLPGGGGNLGEVAKLLPREGECYVTVILRDVGASFKMLVRNGTVVGAVYSSGGERRTGLRAIEAFEAYEGDADVEVFSIG